MNETVSKALLQNIIDAQKNLITIFEGEKLLVANRAFLKFFKASDIEDFKDSFRNFVDCFVPHPSYFNRSSLVEGEAWHESIQNFAAENQVVSMLTPSYEPHAFSVKASETIEGLNVVTFEDVTRTLIERVMIENDATTDRKSGAYDKKYFTHIAKNFDDAALFNKKLIGVCKITLDSRSDDESYLKDFARKAKKIIRNDDMLVRWSDESFLLVCLVDDEQQINPIIAKLKTIDATNTRLMSLAQKEGESIASLLGKI